MTLNAELAGLSGPQVRRRRQKLDGLAAAVAETVASMLE
jgi:hypothetical protein